jgi:hypothetical protein
MGILRRFSEIGLRLAERIDRQSETAACAAEAAILPDDTRDACARSLHESARSFAQVSRAVSVAIALEDRIERGPPLESPPFGPELVCAVPREARLGRRRDEVAQGVRKAIDLSAEARPRLDVDRLCRDLDAMLDREVAAVDAFLSRPADATITRLCERLGINPDWAFAELRAEYPSPDRGGMGPVAKQREGGVTDLRDHATRPQAQDEAGVSASPSSFEHPILPSGFAERGPSFPFQGKDHAVRCDSS